MAAEKTENGAENQVEGEDRPEGAAGAETGADKLKGMEAVYDIPVQVSTVLGKTSILVSKLMTLQKGDVVELDRRVGEAIEIFVNRQLVARGELIVADGKLGVTLTEIIKIDLHQI